ncbi:hypothetical protein [Sinorhizobium meliloti]|uniref:hypothetical protein n=1 Tax=Rhizobium meliloti TaxID=382 RepID=UPI0013E347E8|nr:hypothetical protein [Sinorhizobium meliloti]
MIARCAGIAAGTVPSQDCRRIISSELPEDLRFARCGQHFIVFVDNAEQVIIVDFLHARTNLPRRLAAQGGIQTSRESLKRMLDRCGRPSATAPRALDR